MGENSYSSQALSFVISAVIQKNLQITEMHLFATLAMLNDLDVMEQNLSNFSECCIKAQDRLDILNS